MTRRLLRSGAYERVLALDYSESMLLETACQSLQERNLGGCITLFARCDNTHAIDFYCERHGFRVHSRYTNYYRPVSELVSRDAWLLVRRSQNR